MVRGTTKEKLSRLAIKVQKECNEWLEENNLTLKKEKKELLYLNRGHTGNQPTENTNEIKGISLNVQTLNVKECITYLGVTMHKNTTLPDTGE